MEETIFSKLKPATAFRICGDTELLLSLESKENEMRGAVSLETGKIHYFSDCYVVPANIFNSVEIK